MKSQALCAEQWLTHAATMLDVRNFIGPTQDERSLEQLLDVGDSTGMKVVLGGPNAGYGDTEGAKSVLRQGTEAPIVALAHSHE